MFCIIKIEETNGYHEFEMQSHRKYNWMGDGWIEVPENLIASVVSCGGYCDLAISGGVLEDISQTEKPPPPPDPEPTEIEQLRARVADLQNQILTMRLGG